MENKHLVPISVVRRGTDQESISKGGGERGVERKGNRSRESTEEMDGISSESYTHDYYSLPHCFIHTLIFLQIFTESLLCSNDISKISLAGDLLTVTPSPASPSSPSPATPTRAGSPSNHFNYSLSYETSLELVHNAAKEYFNSAQSFMDDDMDLARYA